MSGSFERRWRALSLAAASSGDPMEMMIPPTPNSSIQLAAMSNASPSSGAYDPISQGMMSCPTFSRRVSESRVVAVVTFEPVGAVLSGGAVLPLAVATTANRLRIMEAECFTV